MLIEEVRSGKTLVHQLSHFRISVGIEVVLRERRGAGDVVNDNATVSSAHHPEIF